MHSCVVIVMFLSCREMVRIMKNFDIKEQIILQICDSEILIDCTPHARKSQQVSILIKSKRLYFVPHWETSMVVNVYVEKS